MRGDDRAALHTVAWLLGIVAAVCVVWFLRAASVVAVPLAAAFFVATLVYPVQQYLHRRIPRPGFAALVLTMALIVVVIGGGMWVTAEAVDEAAEAAPQHAQRAEQLWQNLEQWARQSPVPLSSDVLASVDVRQQLTRIAGALVRLIWEIASGLVLVLFLVALMLLEAPIWTENARRMLRDGTGAAVVESTSEIARKVRTYLYVRTVLGLASAAAAAIWLLLLRVDLVLVWAVLTFALNYIPNIGSIVAVLPPALMALLQHGPVHALVTVGGLAVFEQIIGNFIDPRMQGRRLQISPVVVLIAVVFWTWMWGPVGALLGVPVTVTLIAAAQHVPALRPLTAMLAAERSAGERPRAA